MSGPPHAARSWPARLARLAPLPTVWSNCLAAVWLASGSQAATWQEFFRALDLSRLLLVLAGSSVVWMAWTRGEGEAPAAEDAARGCPRLPRLGWELLGGCLLIAAAGRAPATLAVALLLLVCGQLLLPRSSVFAPCFRGTARLALYLAAASTTPAGINGWAIWGGVVMAAFVTGSEFIIRQQELGQRFDPTPLLLLAAPLVLAWVMNNGPYRESAWLLGAVLLLWLARGLRQFFRPAATAPPSASGALLPAMVLVDWLAVADAPRTSGLIFFPLFLLTLALPSLTPRRRVVSLNPVQTDHAGP